eukprot:6204742-Amphidinium_carterae.3
MQEDSASFTHVKKHDFACVPKHVPTTVTRIEQSAHLERGWCSNCFLQQLNLRVCQHQYQKCQHQYQKVAVGEQGALGTVENYNTTFWKDAAANGFATYLVSIDEYENHSARSVKFVHDMDAVAASSESEGDGLDPPTRNSLSDRIGRGEPDPNDSAIGLDGESLIRMTRRRRRHQTLKYGLALSLDALRLTLSLCA